MLVYLFIVLLIYLYIYFFFNFKEFFLRNSDGIAALNLRRGLRQWDQALSLASTFAQNEVSIIAKEYALELEFNGIIELLIV